MIISNASLRPLFEKSGSVPDVSGALQDYFQPMSFTIVSKKVNGFQVQETGNAIDFRGMIQVMTARQLQLKPEGQRAWSWYTIYADPVLTLEVDSVVVYNGKNYRVMSQNDFRLYGYITYEVVQDWTGAGP